jgi:hypothetical protein
MLNYIYAWILNLFFQEKYEAVVEKNTRLEEQMTALSTSFLCLKVQFIRCINQLHDE